ncbi:MAG TPA: hypothetical protein VG326_01850 [Tepidisphaeraceae bacterium]|jgi:hypothetical protein|nr:hypothetical protein [Tepidisphaeraceae bacterium]
MAAEPLSRPGAFLITVDAEGDNLWAKPRSITTRNARYLPRFQSLCEKHGLLPTYLTNWEMANCPAFVEFARDAMARGACEIGMHLHAWNSPPIVPLTADDDRHAPYLIEYPESAMREKINVMTAKLEDVFGQKTLSHRAGRWSFNEMYARLLIEHGYGVDCSVTPHVSWRFCKGDPARDGGSDFSDFPESAYFVDPQNIRRPGESSLLEIPMTIVKTRAFPRPVQVIRRRLSGSFYGTIIMRRLFPDHAWLMPNGRNGQSMLEAIRTAKAQARPYIEMAIHSSELMPGGSQTFATADSIEKLYDDLESLFSAAATDYTGCTLSQYRERMEKSPPNDPSGPRSLERFFQGERSRRG